MTRNRCLERERKKKVGATILATFLINVFLIVFSIVNIQPSCSKTRMGYFNIKVRLLNRET